MIMMGWGPIESNEIISEHELYSIRMIILIDTNVEFYNFLIGPTEIRTNLTTF